MKTSDFTGQSPGKLLKNLAGDLAFVPNPLPGAVQWTPRLVTAISEAESASTPLASFPCELMCCETRIVSDAATCIAREAQRHERGSLVVTVRLATSRVRSTLSAKSLTLAHATGDARRQKPALFLRQRLRPRSWLAEIVAASRPKR